MCQVWLVLQFVLCEPSPVLLLDSHAEQPKRLPGCNATLLFELQRVILGKFLLISSQISTFLISTGVLSSHLVIYFPASLLSISYPDWDSISNTSKDCRFSGFLWIFIHMKTWVCIIVRGQVYPQISFYAFCFVLFLNCAKIFRHIVENCRWSHYIIKCDVILILTKRTMQELWSLIQFAPDCFQNGVFNQSPSECFQNYLSLKILALA